MPSVEQFGSIGKQYYSPRLLGSQLYESTQDNGRRLERPSLDGDIQRLLSRQKHRMLLSDSRYIASTFPLVAGMVSQKADYVSSGGWLPYFTGKDKAYGEAVTPILHSALNILDARGPLYSWQRDWWIACRLLDVDGDFVVVHSTTESGFPQAQFIEAHRIGCRQGETAVLSGPYVGLPILNGIIYNAQGRAVAVRFLADDPSQDQDISMRDCEYCAAPRWYSDGRPFPSVAFAVLDWYDVKTARGFEKTAMQVNSALAILETNETGAARTGLASDFSPVSTPSSTAQATPSSELIADGLIRYIKAGNGHDLKAHSSNRPSDGWRAFDKILTSGAAYGMDWRLEMFDLSSLSGAPTRGFQDNINTAIHARWAQLTPTAKRVVLRTVAALASRKDIPFHPEWDQWAFSPPVDFTVDANKDSQTARANIAFGLSSHRAELGRIGYSKPDDILREQATHIASAQRIAAEMSKDGVTMNWRDLVNLSPTGQWPTVYPANPADLTSQTPADQPAAA